MKDATACEAIKKNPIATAETMNAMLPLIECLRWHRLVAWGRSFAAAVGVCWRLGECIGLSMLNTDTTWASLAGGSDRDGIDGGVVVAVASF